MSGCCGDCCAHVDLQLDQSSGHEGHGRQQHAHSHPLQRAAGTHKTALSFPAGFDPTSSAARTESHSREVELALADQRVDDSVHDWHQNQDQNRVDCLVGGGCSVSIQEVDTAHQRERDESKKESHLHVLRLDFKRTLSQKKRKTVWMWFLAPPLKL